MKTILFCIHKKSPFYRVIPEALGHLGFNVYLFDYYQPDFSTRVLGLSNTFFHFDPKRKMIDEKINQSLQFFVNKIKPDYLFMIKGLHISNRTIVEIKKSGVVTINWFQDLLEFMPWLKKHGFVYDYLFTPDPLMKRELKKHNIKSYFLPLASEPDERLNSADKIYDVVFSGQYTARREKLFKDLSKLNSRFIIWGFPAWEKSGLKKHYKGFIPTVEEMLSRFRQSKIVVNVQTAEDKYPSDVVSLRAFETTGVGTFLLNWKHNEIDKFWKDKKEIVNFTNSSDIYDKVVYFLKNSQKREAIARAGYKRTKKDHTWEKRLETMFSIVR